MCIRDSRKMVPGSGSINYLRAEINVDKGKVRIFADLEVCLLYTSRCV